MKNKLRWSLFWGLTAIFIVAAVFLLSPTVTLRAEPVLLPVILALSISLLLLGGAIIYLTIKDRLTGLQMIFMLLTGVSASGITVSLLLHIAIFRLFIYWFGPEFWTRIGLSNEPLFFFLGLIFFPVTLLAGIIGTMVLVIIKRRKHK